MVFSSSIFLFVLLPATVLLYYIGPKFLRNLVLLIASLIFYAWGAPKFISIVLISVVLDYYLVKKMNSSESRKKIYLMLSLLLNVGLLLYFKYTNFFIENLNNIFSSLGFQEFHWTRILLPVGISFFTFQKISYTLDIYNKVKEPLQKLTDYILYILLFPQLIAGPIVRFNEISEQLINRQQNETISNRIKGLIRFTIGLSKKVLIANVVAENVDFIFLQNVDDMSSSLVWFGIISYAIQIYFDFSGYSDMAIGLGLMFGFKFPENFNNPYVSRSITEFWRRWHMTLGAWMKDYLYIPLGGSRVKSTKRLYFNLWVVFLISGLWHGASWNFVFWGAYHGFFLVLDRIFLFKVYDKIGKYPSIIFTFLLTLVGWVFFRAVSLDFAFSYIKKMFIWSEGVFSIQGIINSEIVFVIGLGLFFSFFVLFPKGKKIQDYFFGISETSDSYIIPLILSIILLLVCISYITSSGFNPFIYFRF